VVKDSTKQRASGRTNYLVVVVLRLAHTLGTYLPAYSLTLLPFAKKVGQLVSSKQVGQTKKEKEKEKGLVAN